MGALSAPARPAAPDDYRPIERIAMMLQELDHLPTGLLDTPAVGLLARLGRPTLIHLPGRRERPLFVSVLLHGNEDTGWDAVRRLLARYDSNGSPLPRALSLFLGNLEAAERGLRRLEGQPDYNRVWPGGEGEGPEQRLMARAVEAMAARDVFASVDLHNNTGLNPHYACVNRLDNRFLHLATLFSRTVVYFIRPTGVQSMAMAELCPAVTLECGKTGLSHGIDHALEFVDACLHLAEHPAHPVAEHDIDLFHTVATVKITDGVGFSFNGPPAPLTFPADLDRFNFRELPAGTSLGRCAMPATAALRVTGEQGRDVGDRFFRVENGELRTRIPVMPSMLTTDARVIRQDCLCYLMERYQDHRPH